MPRKTRNRKTRKRRGGGLGAVGKLALGATGVAMASAYKLTPINTNLYKYTPYANTMNKAAASMPNMPIANLVNIPTQNEPVNQYIKCKASRKTCIGRHHYHMNRLVEENPGLTYNKIKFY